MLCQILLVPSHWTMATDRYAGCYSSATVAAEDLFHGAGDLGSLYPPVQTDMTSMSTVLRGTVCTVLGGQLWIGFLTAPF